MSKFIFFLGLLFSLIFFQAGLVYAQTDVDCNNKGGTNCDTDNKSAGATQLVNPLPGVNTPQELIGKIINSVLGVVGSLALLMFVYGGLTWMTSSGSQEKVKKGRDILLWSAIGLAIIFTSYGLVRVLLLGVRG